MANRELFKHDAFGSVRLESTAARVLVIRDVARAHRTLRWLARRLARREARALTHLAGEQRVPDLVEFHGSELRRTYLAGSPLHRGDPPTRRYFADALRVLARIHRRGVAHNDLAKEANWLSMPGERAAIVDFQLAVVSTRRGRWFRLLAREDLRHLLKHKRHYVPDCLTARQRAILARPSCPARFWRAFVKPLYLFVTRRLLGWPERFGAEERQRAAP